MARKKVKAKKRFNLRDEYKKVWRYLRESKRFIYTIIAVFFFFVLVGVFIPAPDFLYNQIIDFISKILAQTKGMSQFQLITYIVSNNLKSTFFGIFFGIILGIFPATSAIVNGYLLGFVSLLSINNGSIWDLWKLFPHGIFELPAVFISLGLGLKMGSFIFQKKKLESFRNYFINSFRTFLLVVVPLLMIAGIIEGTLMILLK